jgi:hypothetical protein
MNGTTPKTFFRNKKRKKNKNKNKNVIYIYIQFNGPNEWDLVITTLFGNNTHPPQ